MGPKWRIELLGGLKSESGDRVVTRFSTQKTGVLLAFLAYYREHPHPRDVLVDLLWPQIEPNAARASLRVALHALRQRLEPSGTPAGSVLIANRSAVSLNPAAITVDVADFQAALRAAPHIPRLAERAAHLARAIDLYRGELLPGYYEPWILTERRHVLESYLEALHQQVTVLEQIGDLEQALAYARRAVRADPLREEAHYDLMRLYTALGQPSATLSQYQELERLLREELGGTPSPATRALAEELQSSARAVIVARMGSRPTPHDQQPATDVSLSDTISDTPDSSGTPVSDGEAAGNTGSLVGGRSSLVGHLPSYFTRFFGREEEIAQIVETLCCPETRLVTLTGPGGSGKTRLAIAVAGRLIDAFGGSVWFVPLADLADARHLPDAAAEALALPRSTGVSPMDQLLELLRHRPALLVLDNFEHLVEEGSLIVRSLLERAPRLTCLITSRQRLNLGGEQEFALLPLPTPRRPDLPQRLMQYPSVQLFVHRARAARPAFELTKANAAAVAALCDRLEGLPLALELAAARASVLTPRQLLEHLERRFELLVSPQRDLPARHRTLRATIDGSYQLLSPERRRLFARLSIFRGGWTLEAANEICGDALTVPTDVLDDLSHLQECSLVIAEESGDEIRYRVLETLREYGAGQVAPEEQAALARRHAAYYTERAEAARAQHFAPESGDRLDRFEEERENLRAALAWSLTDEGSGVMGLRLATALGSISEGRLTEGAEWVEAALARAPDAPSALRADALHVAGRLALVGPGANLDVSRTRLEESLLLYRASDDRPAIAAVLLDLGFCARAQEEFAAARRFLEECLELRREQGDRVGAGWALERLGWLAEQENDLPVARRLFEEFLTVGRECGDALIVTYALHSLGWICSLQGELETAQSRLEQSVAMARELGSKASRELSVLSLRRVAWRQMEPASARLLLEANLAFSHALGYRRDAMHTLGALGHLAREQGDYEQCAALYRESLALRQELGDRFAITQVLEDFAGLAGRQGQYERAVRLLGAAEAMLRMLGRRLPVAVQVEYQRTVAEARARLSEAAYAAAWAAGQQMTDQEAVAYALGVTGNAVGP